MKNSKLSIFFFMSLVSSTHFFALDYIVTTADIEASGGLREALDTINLTVDLNNSITIPQGSTLLFGQVYNLPPIEIPGKNLTIMGPAGDATLNGQNVFRAFFISSGNVVIDHMKITNARAIGGAGGDGESPGGGGLGAGGGFFVKSGATLTLGAVSITSARAQGGNGGNATNMFTFGGGGGGGGMGGSGGSIGMGGGSGGGGGLFGAGGMGDGAGGGSGGGGLFGSGGIGSEQGYPESAGGGGGGIPLPGDGENGQFNSGGDGGGAGIAGLGGLSNGNSSIDGEPGGFNTGGGGGAFDGTLSGGGGQGGYNGGGGGSASAYTSGSGGGSGGEYGGGGSTGFGSISPSGFGGFGGGGGGGGMNIDAGAGGFGGGGGGAGPSPAAAASGGFGGGGGGGAGLGGPPGSGGYLGGDGGASGPGANEFGGGGGGAGLGGAIFIDRGGTVIINDGTSLSDSTVINGLGGVPIGSASPGRPGQSLGVNIFMMASAQLTLDINDTFELPYGIAGDQGNGGGSLLINGVTKTGTGSVTLGGEGSYSGYTNVDAGTLVITGSITTPTIVRNGGTLKGNGIITNSITVQNGGSIFPGVVSTILQADSLVLSPLSQVIIEADNTGASSSIELVGNVALDGILQVNFSPGAYERGKLFTIITTEGVISGQFSSTLSSLGIEYETFYQAQSVFLRIPCGTLPQAYLSLVGIRDNARRMGEYLNANREFFSSSIAVLNKLSTDQLSAALQSISPGTYSFSTYVSQNTMFDLNKVVASRMSTQRCLFLMGNRNSMLASLYQESLSASEELLAYANTRLPRGKATQACAGEDQYAIWASGIGDFSHQKKQRQNPAFDSNAKGGLLGFETYKMANMLLGATAGYAHSDINIDSDAGYNMTNYYFVGLYDTIYLGNGYFEFCLWGTYNRFKNERRITYPGFDAKAHSSHTGWQLTPSISFGYDIAFKAAIIEPFASLDAVISVEQEFSEKKASPYNMRQSSRTSEFLRLEIGVNAYETWKKGWGSILIRETASYVLRKPYHTGTVTAGIVGAPGEFTVYSFSQTQNVLSAGAEIFLKHKKGGFVSATYSGEFGFGSGYLSNELIGKIGFYF